MRRMGLWQRLRAAPLSRAFLLGNQLASGALIAALLFTLIFAAGMLVFGVRVEGSVPGFVGLIVAFALMTAAFGLFIAAIGRTPEATRGLAICATLVMVMLGGAWIPSVHLPAVAADRFAGDPDALGRRRLRRDDVARSRLRRGRGTDRRPARVHVLLRRDRRLRFDWNERI